MVGAVMLSGCAETFSTKVGRLDPADFGEANRQTFAAMVIDPDPQYEESLTTSGEHAAQAVERYRTDSVKQPRRVSSTSTTGGGGSGGGGGR
jgi:hypothetical protein